MASAPMHLETQILELERLRSRCVSARLAVNSVRQKLAELTEQEAELTASIRSQHETDLRAELERTAREVRDRLAQAEHDLNSAREATSHSRTHRSNELTARFKDDVASIRQKLQSELWVLLSVCDESNEDTPVREAERAHEIYLAQSKFTDEQLNDLDARLQFTEKYLDHCHAGTDAAIPPANVPVKGREASRTHLSEP